MSDFPNLGESILFIIFEAFFILGIFSFLESFFFDFAVPAGACRVFFLFAKICFFNITFWHQIHNLRKNSFRSAPIAPLEVLCASSYGSSKVEIENYVLIMTFWHQIQNLRKISFRSAPIAPPEVLCASSYGSSKVKLEFWSQCKVLLYFM